jgi:hypothetical protein
MASFSWSLYRHLISLKLGMSNRLIPGKGCHFQEGSYVEYSGNLSKEEIPVIKDQLEKLANELF